MEERWENTRSDFSRDVNSTCASGHFVQRLSSNDACQDSVQPVYVYVHAETSRRTTEGECDPVHSGASRREPRSPCTLHPRCIICVPRRWGGLSVFHATRSMPIIRESNVFPSRTRVRGQGRIYLDVNDR